MTSPSSVTFRLMTNALTWASIRWLGRKLASRNSKVRTPSLEQTTALRENLNENMNMEEMQVLSSLLTEAFPSFFVALPIWQKWFQPYMLES